MAFLTALTAETTEKLWFVRRFLLHAMLIAALALLTAPQRAVAAYWEATLPGSAFAGVIPGSGGFLYGTTYSGGDGTLYLNGDGTLYKVPPDLSAVTTIQRRFARRAVSQTQGSTCSSLSGGRSNHYLHSGVVVSYVFYYNQFFGLLHSLTSFFP